MGVALGLLSAFVPAFQSCDTKQYEECPTSLITGSWGVTKATKAFGEYDSLYYMVNPIGNVNDSVYFNGNYTDSYYHSDSTRVMLRYTTDDSIMLHIDRMYSVQINPPNLIVNVKAEKDSAATKCELRMVKDVDNDNIYRCGPDSIFKKLLLDGSILKFTATNGVSTSEPVGSQNYEFFFDATGFSRALHLADSLNMKNRKYVNADSLKTNADSLKAKTHSREADTHRRKAADSRDKHRRKPGDKRK